jgi:H+/gluconate symporter-like permease
MNDRYSIIPLLVSFLILVLNMVIGFYFIFIGRPVGIMIFGLLSIIFVILMNNREQEKYNNKFNR